MKRILPFIILLYAGTSAAQLNVWRWQNPLPEGGLLLSVQMVSLNIIYACGDNATFLSTTDGGQSWNIKANLFKSSQSLNSLSFFDQNLGMCCGDGGKIIKTTDGGNTWQQLSTKVTAKLNSILVVDQNIALAITLGGGIIRTTDGGNTWNPIAYEGTFALYSIRMLRPDFMTIAGYGGTLMKSVDTGKTWLAFNTPNGNTYFSACFTDNNTATVVADQGLIIHTIDGGTNWGKEGLDSTIISASLNAVDGKDPNTLAIVGDYGTILYTSDGGTHWNISDIGTREHIKAVSFFDKNNATAVGHDGVVLRTTDGGKDWFFLPHIPFTDILYAVAFPKGDTSLGLTCGYNGTILRTTNGGASWAVSSSGTNLSLRGISFLDTMNAIIVGDKGTMLKSTDAGLTWNALQSPTTKNLYAISFATPNDGIVVGDHGDVFRTYLAGQFWTREYPGVVGDTDYFRTISFPDINHAFMSGQFGYYRSVDGGVSWSFSQIFADYLEGACLGISFADSLHGGLLFGDGGPHLYLVQVSSDGGLTWAPRQTLTTTPFGMQFIDRLHATIVGKGGYISHMTDGKTFQDQQSNTLSSLVGVCYGTTLAGTAVGYRGNIMRITTNEKTVSEVMQSPIGTPQIIIDGNYPNPFSGSTTIRYYLPSPGFTTIEIYSIGGKLVGSRIGEYETSGEQSIKWNAAGLASGTYICRITSNGMSAEGKLTIEK